MIELYFKEKPEELERIGSLDPLKVEAIKHSRWGWKVKVENDTDAYWALYRGQATLLSPESLEIFIPLLGAPIRATYVVPGKEPESSTEPDVIAPEEV
jgi:hypothetical protein